jgi:hypothetical protein
MSRWTLKPWALLVLGSVVFLMLLIVILPDVDLPDTAFHSGNAPIVVHARVTSAPATINVAAAFRLAVIPNSLRRPKEHRALAIYSASNFLPILFRSIRR